MIHLISVSHEGRWCITQSARLVVLERKQEVLWPWGRWHDGSNPGNRVVISRV